MGAEDCQHSRDTTLEMNGLIEEIAKIKKTSEATIATLNQSLEQAQSKITDLEKARETTEAQIQKLKQELGEASDEAEAQINKYLIELAQAKAQAIEQDDSRSKLLVQMVNLKTEIKAAEERAGAEDERLNSQIATIQEQAQRDIQKLKEQLSEADRSASVEKEDLQRQLQQSRIRIDVLEKALADAEGKLASARAPEPKTEEKTLDKRPSGSSDDPIVSDSVPGSDTKKKVRGAARISRAISNAFGSTPSKSGDGSTG